MEILPSPDTELLRFRALFRNRFGVDSKPEQDALVTKLGLSPERALQVMEDLDTLIRIVLDTEFDAPPPGYPPFTP